MTITAQHSHSTCAFGNSELHEAIFSFLNKLEYYASDTASALAKIEKLITSNPQLVNSANFQQQTPLMLAASSTHPAAVKVVELLLQHNADINLTDSQERTARTYAVNADNLQVISLLDRAENQHSVAQPLAESAKTLA